MSRVGKKPITMPAGVSIDIKDNNVVTVKGPKGELTKTFVPEMTIKCEGNILTVERPDDLKRNKSLHGLTRALLNNMVVGVSEGYEKILDINGVGYKASKQGKKLTLNLGYSHPVIMEDPEGIETIVEGEDRVVRIKGIDKEVLGQYAAEIRAKRPPEPYKGKGIKYREEHIRRKVGKTGKK